jgi:hypothetical protein
VNPLVAKTLAKDSDFIKAIFHIGRFITVAVDTEIDHANIEALWTDLDSASTKINVITLHLIVHYRLCLILTPPFYLETNQAFLIKRPVSEGCPQETYQNSIFRR